MNHLLTVFFQEKAIVAGIKILEEKTRFQVKSWLCALNRTPENFCWFRRVLFLYPTAGYN